MTQMVLTGQILRALSSLGNSALFINLSGRSLETKDVSIYCFRYSFSTSHFESVLQGYTPTFPNLSNLHFPFLIVQNACFMISHLRFAHLLEKALGLLFKTDITKESPIFGHSFIRAIDRLILAKRYESTRFNV